MAHIVPFRTTAARAADEAEAERSAGAEIVIFPGIRRERHADPQDGSPLGPQAGTAGSSSARDWLVLLDELQPDQHR
jgi:hypothetical protein